MNLKLTKTIILLVSVFSFCAVDANITNVRVRNNAKVKNANISGVTTVFGNINVFGTVNNAQSINTQGAVTQGSVALFADNTGRVLKGSSLNIDNAANITINGITKNGSNVNWPSVAGIAGQALMSDGAGNLVYATPSGSGNVSTVSLFSSNNRLLVTDTITSASYIKESGITLDGSNNITGVNNLTANTIYANLTGNATSATVAGGFTTNLVGDVTGGQHSTVVISVGGGDTLAADIVSMVDNASTATSENVPLTIVKRDAAKNFKAGDITANSLVGNVTGTLYGNATSAITTTSATYFTGSFGNDLSGTQLATVVTRVGGQLASNIASMVNMVSTATSESVAGTIVKRDVTGSFKANRITADFIGSVTGNASGQATTAINVNSATDFLGSLTGDVDGKYNTTVVKTVGGQSAANVAAAALIAGGATNLNNSGLSQVIRRDGAKNFVANKITADLLGTVTGNLYGNASTATYATNVLTSLYTTDFLGSLTGDVTGLQGATIVKTVGGKTAAQVSSFVDTVNLATSNNAASTIVRRNISGDFTTNMITLTGDVTSPTDATTKEYVDAQVSSAIVPKNSALVVSLLDTATAGLYTIDGLPIAATNRVLLVGQNNGIYNGLWEAQLADWTRPADFASGTQAQGAYVLTTTGFANAGSSWICNTPLSYIDTDTVIFVEFAIPGKTTAANVGAGDGKVFRDKTGSTINLKTILAGEHMVVTDATSDVQLSTDATDANIPYTIVLRDNLLSFSANLAGYATLNVLKSGDTMTGDLNIAPNLAIRSVLNLRDSSGTKSVGLRAPNAIATTYTLDLPAQAPVAGQFLQSISPTGTTWANLSASPTLGKVYYVSLAGSDSNDGSLSAPFEHVKYAVSQANSVASSVNPVTIILSAGIFYEHNAIVDGGPIAITGDYISIVGASAESTIIKPLDVTSDLFTTTVSNLEFLNLSFQADGGSTAKALNLNSTSYGRIQLESISTTSFATGLSLNKASGVYPVVFIRNSQFCQNGLSIGINDITAEIKSSCFRGSLSAPAANVGITLTGSQASLTISNTNFFLYNTAISTSTSDSFNILNCSFISNKYGIECTGGIINACGTSFLSNTADAVNIKVSNSGAEVYLENSIIKCWDGLTPSGKAIQVTGNGLVSVSNSVIDGAAIGIEAGVALDADVNTSFVSNSLNLMYCILGLNQLGSSSIKFVGGAIDPLNISYEKPENVQLAAFSKINNTCLAFGNKTNVDTPISDIQVGLSIPPSYEYKKNFYDQSGIVFQNLNSNPLFSGNYNKNDDAGFSVSVGSKINQATLDLISDTSVSPGTSNNLRGWTLGKIGNLSEDFAFTYTNTDLTGQAAIGPNTVMSLNGLDNEINFPTAINAPYTTPKLIWASDTNLYRNNPGILETDGGLIISGLTPNMVVATDASKKLVSSGISETQLGYLSSVTANIQDQIDSKVAKAGDTMTGALILPAGSASSPALIFAGSTNTGLSVQSTDTLVFSTLGVGRMRITDDGSIYTSRHAFSPSVIHNSVSGLLSSTSVINIDISSSANIADSKLATISSIGKVQNSATTATGLNVASAIVARDLLGTFTATAIYANLFGNASTTSSFSGQLGGDVIGTQTATIVNSVGGKTSAQISNAVDMIYSATSSALASMIVMRDMLGSFTANMISLSGNTLNSSDVATKGYADGAINASYVGNILMPDLNEIYQDGLYTLTSNLNASIKIYADNVIIDLRDFTLSSDAGFDVILVEAGLTNIEIKNGKIEDLLGSQHGLRVNSGCRMINLSNLKFLSCRYGIRYDGVSTSNIVGGKIQNCIFDSCEWGVTFAYAEKMLIQNCQAFNCTRYGFSQAGSKYNVFENCSAFETMSGDPSADAIGFSSRYGTGNLFNGCLAEGTTKSAGTYTGYSTRAIGFLLTGTEGEMENDTKIINSVANTTLVQTTSCTAYGILLEPVLKTSQALIQDLITTYSHGAGYIKTVAWSPCGKYVAIAGEQGTGGYGLRALKFNGSAFSLISSVALSAISTSTVSVDWSPNGKYLATGDNPNGSTYQINIFSFDGSSLSNVEQYTNSLVPVVSAVKWSPDGKYLAVSGFNGNVIILGFYPSAASGSRLINITLVHGSQYYFEGPPVNALCWSPDGKYLAIGMDNGAGYNVVVLAFTGYSISNIIATYNHGASVNSVNWSPDSRYIAIGGVISGGYAARVLKFDVSYSASLSLVASYANGADVNGVCWAKCGKYLAICADYNISIDNLKVLSFDGSTLTIPTGYSYQNDAAVNAVDWSPDSRYLITGGLPVATGSQVKAFGVMVAPTDCLIQDNKVCNTTSYLSTGTGYSRQGIGICGSGDNLYVKNVGFANDVNFNRAVYNVYGSSLLSCNAKKFDNLWQPAYENSYGYSPVCS